jgi:uncharacterized protein (DUF2147 family)
MGIGIGVPPAQEMMMRKLFAVAAFLLASTAAQAQYTFEYGGRTIRIDPDRGTISIPGVYDNTGKRNKRSRNVDEYDRSHKQTPDQARTDPQAPDTTPAPTQQAPATPPPATAKASPEPYTTTTTTATTTARTAPSSDIITSTQPAATAPAPQVQEYAAPAAKPAPAPVVATAPSSQAATPAPAPVTTAAAAPSANSPLGMWQTEEKEGKVRIESCGANLCGYSVDAKTNQNGEKVLINMKPVKDKWTGRIYDPNSGSSYDSTIALKGSDSLRVQGCAFGGMFCGGQTWSRLN